MATAGAGVSLTAVGTPAHTAPTRAGILLDRDGTIIVDHGYVGSVDRVEFIEGSPEAIASFNRVGIPVAVLTNQAGVARGFYGIEDVAHVHRYIANHLAEHGAHIDLFIYCPYHPREWSRPSPGPVKTASPHLAWRRLRERRSTLT